MQKARRAGLAGRLLAGRAPALVAMLAVACLAGVLLTLGRGGGVTIERTGGGEAPVGQQEVVSGEKGEAAEAPSPVLVVHVDGAVATPGVYELTGPDLRVNDAVEAAGGLLPEADTSSMNLAAALADGQKVLVPARGADGQPVSGSAGAGADGQPGGSSLVNINLATADQLQALSGVGEATARAIVEDREAHGPFSSIEDLMRVSGIGQKKFEKLKGQICV